MNVGAAPNSRAPEPLYLGEKTGFHLVGLNRSYKFAERSGITDQWRDAQEPLQQIRQAGGEQTFGLCWNSREAGFDYLCGVRTSHQSLLAPGLIQVPIPTQHYAVFLHRGPMGHLGYAFAAIHGRWLPRSGYRPVAGPVLECYRDSFDWQRGAGPIEIWLPVRRAKAGTSNTP
ncbi:GyrI-like domain-containing protein [Gilvimarinus sp. F26214L]|uniref:GyrI-like domain-containing protein n=1 Tax=Gilvimarinus sp. DZF01 TaxID=3461371 RepID=UPI00404521E7